MVKVLIFWMGVLLFNFGFGQPSFRAGVNFPLYHPDIHSIDEYLQLVGESGGKAIRQMT